MSETLRARDFIVDFLRRELVGPSPGHPAVQIDGEEILRPQDPPRQRYGAGIPTARRALLSNGQPAPDFRVEPNWIHCTVRARIR